MSDKLYRRPALEKYLEENGLPHSHPTIIKYEKRGIIPSPRQQFDDTKYPPRAYTWDEIVQIGEILRSKIKGGKNGGK